ncbi:aldehyde dehydrogenase family protein [Cupriavidus basilensis]
MRHPDVRAVSFTGGTATGKRIIERAGSGRSFRWNWAASRRCWCSTTPTWSARLDASLFTIFSINGERCTAGSRIFVQDTVYDDFARKFAERARRFARGRPDQTSRRMWAP